MGDAVRVVGFDHLVLTVTDVERSLAWYTGVLGLEGARVEAWRAGEVPFPSVRVDGTTIIDLLAGERTGVNADHLCLVVGPETDVDAVAGGTGGLDVVSGPVPVERWGARGIGRSVYVLDPDGNVVELRSYPSGTDG